MILEAILYFVLGFLSSALLALMISPAIWNRAVELTKRRIESSVPLTLNEIQADKDQLRAEFAMSTRRLEMSVDELKNKASNQLIEINRRRDEVNKLSADSNERLSELKILEAKASALAKDLADRETRLSDLTDRHNALEDEHDALLEEVTTLRENYSNASQTLKSKEIELSASGATIQALKGTVATIDMSENQQVAKIAKLQDDLVSAKERLNQEKAKRDETLKRAKAAESEAKTLTRKLEKKSKDAGAYRDQGHDSDQSVSDLTSELINEKTKTVELEAKLAKQALQTQALLNDASNENVQTALRQMNDELEERSLDVQGLRKERDRLASELDAIRASTSENWADERQEKAFLRQRINDLAAQVAAMTATFEGDGSKISQILKEAENTEPPKGSKAGTTSLADRIRAVQEAANN